MKITLNTNRESGWGIWQGLAVIVVIGFLLSLGIGYVGKKANKAAITIGSKYTNDLDKVPEFFILHDRYNVGPAVDGTIQMEIPDAAIETFGNWQVLRSTNLVNWEPVTSLWTDKESARLLCWEMMGIETNLAVSPMTFYGARMER